MEERWKKVTGPAEGFPYEVSNKGRVRRAKPGRRTREGYVLSPGKSGHGYLHVVLSKNNNRKMFYIHHLVACAFLGLPPGKVGSNDWQIDHIDDDKTNNCAENLEWVTREENRRRAAESNRLSGERNGGSKLTEELVLDIRREANEGGINQKAWAAELGVHRTTIRRVINRETWDHI